MLQRLKTKRVIIPIAILIIFVGTIIFFSDRLTFVILPKIHYSKTKTPEMYLVPIPREVRPSSEESSTHYVQTYKNIKFKVPWVLREKMELNRSTLFAFVNKKGIQIEQQSSDEKLIKRLLEKNPAEAQKTEFLFSKENLESEYAIVNLILHTTPDQASFFRPYHKIASVTPLLMLRGPYSTYGDVIYKFSSDNLKGFQFGDPQTTENVHVHIFNKRDQLFKILFVRASQAEIDLIVSSMEFS